MIIRDLSREDAPLLALLHHQTFPKGWSQEEFATLLQNSGICGFIAYELSQPIGFILAQWICDQADILTFCVLPTQQRKGIGRSLLTALIDFLKNQGIKELILEVAHHNQAAINLYKHQGFTPIGRRKHYYQEPSGERSDAIVMAKTLSME